MATTQLFVELLVIGIGAAIWLTFLVALLFGLTWEQLIHSMNAVNLAGLSSVAYVVGIVTDRLARAAFFPIEKRCCSEVFKGRQKSVEELENFVLSSQLREQVVYNRSRLRICRAWILHFALISVFASIWALKHSSWIKGAIAIGAIALTHLTAYVTKLLAQDHYKNIHASYTFLKKNRS